MTIIASYRWLDKAIYISDFRVTIDRDKERIQKDISMKFIEIGKNIGLFLSGNLILWKEIISCLNKVSVDLRQYFGHKKVEIF